MTLHTVSYADTRCEPIEYLLRGRIPTRKVSLIVADGGVGKSVVMCRVAAGVTRGDLNGGGRTPGRVLLINMEDGDGDTTRPRLEAQGADLSLVEHLDHSAGETLILPGDFERLRDHVHDTKCQLVILDPIAACLSPKITFALDSSIRSAVMPLARLAEASGAAIILVHHLNGRVNASAYRRLLGGTALANIVRAVYALGVHPEDRGNPNGRRVLAWVKGNLDGTDKSSLECNLSEGRLEFGGVVPVTANELLCERRLRSGFARAAPRRDEAVEFLVDELAGGARVLSADLEARAEARGIALTTLDRARGRAGVRSEREGRAWVTRLDPQPEVVAPAVSNAQVPLVASPDVSPAIPQRHLHEQAPRASDASDDASMRFSLIELDLDLKDVTANGVLENTSGDRGLVPRTSSSLAETGSSAHPEDS